MAAVSSVLSKVMSSGETKFPLHIAIFLLAAVVSALCCFVSGKLLNKEKAPRKIKPFGKERIVFWGRHTFYFFPVEYWGAIIPLVTVFVCVVMRFV
jgi:hypothetical protein